MVVIVDAIVVVVVVVAISSLGASAFADVAVANVVGFGSTASASPPHVRRYVL
jgi:hypothetical protein